MNIQPIKNVSDCKPLYLPNGLFLKPIARLQITVLLPETVTFKTISNWDLMEKLRAKIQPQTFSMLKVCSSSVESIRFEAELDDCMQLEHARFCLHNQPLALSGFTGVRIRADEAKDDFPTRHDWDSFFRDARNMDEMKAGERPDTIHISNLPIEWFAKPEDLQQNASSKKDGDKVLPCEKIFRKIFEKYGKVERVDVPICDVYRSKMKSHLSGMKTFTFDQEQFFEGYVQFKEYSGFVKTMDEFRGMKLVRKEKDQNLAVGVTVNFDKSKHLSEAAENRRNIVRRRLIADAQAKLDEVIRKQEEELKQKEQQRQKEESLKQAQLEEQRLREEKRKKRNLAKIQEQEQSVLTALIRTEKKKMVKAQKKLDSLRFLQSVFHRIEEKCNGMITDVKIETEAEHISQNPFKNTSPLKGNDLRNKLKNKYVVAQEITLQKRQDRLKKAMQTDLLNCALKEAKPSAAVARSPSVNSISSDDSILNDDAMHNNKKRSNPKTKTEHNITAEDNDSSDGSSSTSLSSSNSSSSSSSDDEGKELNEDQNEMQHGMPPHYYLPEQDWSMGMVPYPSSSYMPGHMMRRGGAYNVIPYGRGGAGVSGFMPFNRNMSRGRPPFPRGGRARGNNFRRRRGMMPTYYDQAMSEQYLKYFKKTSGDYDEYDDDDNRHNSHSKYARRSRSRSRRRSHSRSRSRSRSSRSRSRRSRSRSSRSHSRHRSRSGSRSRRSRSPSHNKSRKLVSTLRRSRSTDESSHSSSRSRSNYRRSSRHHRNKRSWSRKSSRYSSRSHEVDNGGDHHTPHSKHSSKRSEGRAGDVDTVGAQLLTDKNRSKSSSVDKDYRNSKNTTPANSPPSRRSSVDSAKFISPKHKAKSATPEASWL